MDTFKLNNRSSYPPYSDGSMVVPYPWRHTSLVPRESETDWVNPLHVCNKKSSASHSDRDSQASWPPKTSAHAEWVVPKRGIYLEKPLKMPIHRGHSSHHISPFCAVMMWPHMLRALYCRKFFHTSVLIFSIYFLYCTSLHFYWKDNALSSFTEKRK